MITIENAKEMQNYVRLVIAVLAGIGILLGLPIVWLKIRKTRAETTKLELEARELRRKLSSEGKRVHEESGLPASHSRPAQGASREETATSAVGGDLPISTAGQGDRGDRRPVEKEAPVSDQPDPASQDLPGLPPNPNPGADAVAPGEVKRLLFPGAASAFRSLELATR